MDRSARRGSGLFAAFFLAASSLPLAAQDGLISCLVTADAPVLRSEGATELTGPIRIACFGGDPTTVHFLNLDLLLNTPITSAVTGPDPEETEAMLLIDDPRPGVMNTSNRVTYAGQVKGTPGVAPGPPGGPGAAGSGNVYQAFRAPGLPNRLMWNGIPFVPAPGGSARILRIVNVRADVTRLPAQPNNPASVTAFLSSTPIPALPIAQCLQRIAVAPRVAT